MNRLKFTLRILGRNKLFTLINLTGLFLGFTVLIALGSYVTGELSYDSFHTRADRIFRVTMAIDNNNYSMHWARQNIDYLNLLPDEFPQIEHMVRFQNFYARDIAIGKEVYRIDHAYSTDASVFDVFDFELIAGNAKSALAEPNSVVLTESMAHRLYGRTDVLGEIIDFTANNGMKRVAHKITAIMQDLPANTHMPVNLLTSFASQDERSGWAYTYLLLNDPDASAEIEAGMNSFIVKHGGAEEAENFQFPLQKLRDIHLSGGLAREIKPVNNKAQLILFAGVGGLVFLLTLLNYINLTSAQALKRQSEIGVRKILGAGRWSVSAQFLTETLVLSFLGLVLAFLLFLMGKPFIENLLPVSAGLPRILPFVIGVALITAVLAAWFPAVVLTGSDGSTMIKGRIPIGFRGFSARSLMVGFQLVMCISIMSAALISSRQFSYISEKNLGFQDSQVMAILSPAEPLKQRKEYVKKELERIPGVTITSSVMEVPSREIRDAGPVYVNGKGWTEEDAPILDAQVVDNKFIELMDMKIIAGRNFGPEPVLFRGELGEDYINHLKTAPREYIINETALKIMGWTDPADAIGEIMHWEISGIALADGPIIGVIRDYHQETLRNAIDPLVLIQEPIWTNHFLVRIEPGRTAEVLQAIDEFPEFSGFPIETVFLDDLYAQLYQAEQRQLSLMRSFSLLAILLSFLGIFGLLAYVLKCREKELAVRKVLGASVLSITGLVSRKFVMITLIGAIMAIPFTWFLMQSWLEGFAYRIEINMLYFVISLLVVMGVFLMVVLYQSKKIASVNPAHILRSE